MNENYKYRAFISYRHVDRDREWAKWIMERLESYRAPRALMKTGVPQRVGRIFRDDDEIPASSDLGWQLKDSLKDSEYLIVVCSPDTPASAWVRREIAIFQELGRSNRIIPLLVAGEPAESFPPELMRPDGPSGEMIEPLAADVRDRSDEDHEETKLRAWLRIAATLLRCRYDDLANREQRRTRRQRRSVYWAAATLIAIAATSFAYWWDFTRVKMKYFEGFVTEYGIPRGVRPLSESKARRLNVSYAFREQRRRIVRMSRLTGLQKPIEIQEWIGVDPWMEGTAEWAFEYDADGSLIRDELFDGQGRKRLIEAYHFSPGRHRATVAFEAESEDGEVRSAELVTSNELLGSGDRRAEITQNEVFFDDSGRVIERRFKTHRGDTAVDGDGASGRRYHVAPNGYVTAIEFLDEKNRRMAVRTGIARIELTNDPDGRIVSVSLKALDGSNALSTQKYASIDWTYDKDGNPLRSIVHGIDGKVALDSFGIAETRSAYDEHGNIVRNTFHDVEGRPTLNNYGFVMTTSKFDERGNETEQSVYGIGEKPVLDKSGCWRLKFDYDEQHRVVERACYGTNGDAALEKSGYARTRKTYDSRGRLASEEYFDTEGGLILSSEGFARASREYDSRGNLLAVAYFGTDGKPIALKLGYARIAYAYNGRGQLTQTDYFGRDGSPVLASEGIARTVFNYDARGQLVEEQYFGLDGLLKLRHDGYARATMRYDSRGQMIEKAYFGVDGPILVDGAWKTRWTYDSRGYELTSEYFGVDDRPVLNSDGYAKKVLSPDTQGRPTRVSVFGLDGAPIYSPKLQCSSHTWKYDSRGNVTEIAVFGVDGKPANFDGFSRIEQTYDDRNNQTSQSVFGPDGKPALYKHLFSKVVIKYDDHDRPLSQEYFGVDGNPTNALGGCSKVEKTYDARGNLIDRTCQRSD